MFCSIFITNMCTYAYVLILLLY
uniref:Uncharacterized protein n=1 Tax=Rhizophora mucronata TaxID=61149 RepID=A0A2P2PWF1_RHIMU